MHPTASSDLVTVNVLLQGTLLVAAWIVLAAVLFVLPAWLIWNAIMPEIFGLRKITFRQSFGLLVLTGIMFTNPLKLKLKLHG